MGPYRLFRTRSPRPAGPFVQSDPAVVDRLTFSALQTKTDICANSVDPDTTVRDEPSHQGLHGLPFCFSF